MTSDGSLQHIEIGREPNTSVHNGLTLKGKFAQNVCCVDFHPELLLFVAVTFSESITQNNGLSLLHMPFSFYYPAILYDHFDS